MYGGGWSSLDDWSLFQGAPIRYNFLSHELVARRDGTVEIHTGHVPIPIH